MNEFDRIQVETEITEKARTGGRSALGNKLHFVDKTIQLNK
jgi:hypothetical protein